MSRRSGAMMLLLLGTLACGQGFEMARREHDIDQASRAVAEARNDSERSVALGARGRAYSEKARYGRFFKLITPAEHARMFDLALRDHAQAIALAPDSGRPYLERGLTYYERGTVEDYERIVIGSSTPAAPFSREPWDQANADFTRALDRDPRNVQALDMRGIVRTTLLDHDGAIADFAAELILEPRMGRLRLAEAYCRRGSAAHLAKRSDRAIADYEKSLELGGPSDGCDCQPENPLVALYVEKGDTARGWAVVRRAAASGRVVAPEIIESLRKAGSPPPGSPQELP